MKNECYVYLALPGETDFATAGKFEQTMGQAGIPVGRFIYAQSYLERSNAVAIDPIELKLTRQVFETRRPDGIFGAFRDASPDYWGRRVIERHSGKASLTEFDYLLYSPDERAGALSFGLNETPPLPGRVHSRTLHLTELQQMADAVITDSELPASKDAEQVRELLLAGTSMGGARPKAVIEDDNSLWIAKFNHPDDRWNHALVEHSMLKLAHECGIQTAESRIERAGNQDVLLVKRFDRVKAETGYRRARLLSALTILRAEESYSTRNKWSYILLVEELRRISSKPQQDAQELFRRMCFNALISNTDDHPRNHAIIALDTNWRLSPAYDLIPSAPIGIQRRDLAMICGDSGRVASFNNLLSQHHRYLLKREEAETAIRNMEKIVRNRWYKVASAEGVTEKDRKQISGAFAYPGFWLDSSQG